MSLGARATKGGAKGKDRQDKGKSDKPQPKEKVKPQATTEQLRMANMIDRKADDTADVRKMVKMVQDLMEMTCRTEEEVCSALHDSDNDVVAACNLLLETEHTVTGEWQTSEKKKKKPAPAANNGEAEPPREPRERSGPRPRRGEGERGDRGERGEGSARGRGGARGRGAARGGRGGARGARGAPRPRPDRSRDWSSHPPLHSNPMGDTFPATEDWDNEEWSGSLSDTKVFTPSVNPQPAMDGDSAQPLPVTTEDWEAEASAPAEGPLPSYSYHTAAAPHHAGLELSGRVATPPGASAAGVAGAGAGAGGAAGEARLADSFLHPHPHQHPAPTHPVQPMGMSGSLSAAQSQYLSQLTQQTQRHTAGVYTTNYGVYGSTEMASQRKPQRARVPPPSKIPSSAVEMPGGAEGGGFLDVQFGALDDLPDPPKPASALHMPACPPAEGAHEPHHPDPPPVSYSNANAMLSESLSVAEAPPPSQPAPAPEPVVTNSTSSLEKQLSASMKQLSVSAGDAAPLHMHMPQHRHKAPSASASATASAPTSAAASGAASASAPAPAPAPAQNMYSPHPAAHHPPAVYSNVYAPPVNSSAASLSAGAALPQPYPSSVTLTQYQPILNSYQTSSSGGAYSSSALYTAAPYTQYQPPAHAHKHQPKEPAPQYESSAATVSNSLATTSTTQTSTAKVTTTAGHVPVTGNSSSAAGYAGGALYGSQGYAAYDDQLMRSTMPHHMGGYYEVTGYGVGVGGGARDGSFGLGAGERFARSDAASPQQVPAAALPPGYAYYYQPPPPTTYQYGVYPNVSELRVQFGGASGGVAPGKVPAYQPQPPQYDAQDSYKPGGGYGGSGGKGGAAAAADLTNAMYAKTHVTLNKVNSYEKAGFHSGTPPPFGAASHLYIAAPPHHHHHAPQHQMDARMNSSQNRRAESGGSGGRGGSKQPAHNKPAYTHSYWPTN